ncbi:MAG: DUF1822 family protein [Microcoleus sp.]
MSDKDREKPSESKLFVFEGSQEDFDRIISLFETGELSNLLGIEVLDVGTIAESQLVTQQKVINLGQWFQNNFLEAIQEGWVTLEEVLTARSYPAFRSQAVRRAKSIQLGNCRLALILDIAPAEDRVISVKMGVYPIDSQVHLPENLRLFVYESEEILVDFQVPLQSSGIIQELFLLPGEQFRAEVALGDFKQIEEFILLP